MRELDDEKTTRKTVFFDEPPRKRLENKRREELAVREGQGNDRQRPNPHHPSSSSSSSCHRHHRHHHHHHHHCHTQHRQQSLHATLRQNVVPNSEDLSNKMSREDFWNEIRKEAEVEAAITSSNAEFFLLHLYVCDYVEKSLTT